MTEVIMLVVATICLLGEWLFSWRADVVFIAWIIFGIWLLAIYVTVEEKKNNQRSK